MSIEAPARIHPDSGFRLARAETVIIRLLLTRMVEVGRWFWPLGLVIPALVGAAIAHFTPVTKSIWENAGQWPRWWLLAMAITLVSAHLPIVVAHGVTRRSALRALAVSGVLIALLWAGFMVVGHVLERAIYDRLGWSDVMDIPHVFADGYDVLPMFAEYGLIFLAYLATGVLIGGLYYRFGPIRGTLLLVPAMLPVVAIELLLLSTGWYTGLFGPLNHRGMDVSRPPLAVFVGLVLVILSIVALAIYLVLRDVPIRSKK